LNNKLLKMSSIPLPTLKAIAKDKGIKGFSTMSKDLLLITLIMEYGVDLRSHLETKERKETNPENEVSKPKKKAPSEAKKDKSETKEKKQKEKKEKPEFEKSDMVKPKTVYLELEDEKSKKKFWEIISENSDNEKQKYIVRYGKVGNSGTESKNEDTAEKIQKLIKDKKEKGYTKP